MAKKQEEQKTEIHDAGKIDSMPVVIHAQYIKDLSFENPGALYVLQNPPAEERPKTSVDFGMEALKIENPNNDSLYEVILSVTAETRRDDKVIFLTEVSFGSVVSIKDIPEEKHHALLLIEVPRLSFPFVRQIVNDMAMQGGYAPMLLQPVNFHQLYMKRFGNPVTGEKPQEA